VSSSGHRSELTGGSDHAISTFGTYDGGVIQSSLLAVAFCPFLAVHTNKPYMCLRYHGVQAAADGKTAAIRLRNLRADAERAREALTVGEQSLVVARQRAREAQKLVNPLNHPRLQELLQK